MHVGCKDNKKFLYKAFIKVQHDKMIIKHTIKASLNQNMFLIVFNT